MTSSYEPRNILSARINGEKTFTNFVVLESFGDDIYIIDQLGEQGERLDQPRQAEIFDRFKAMFRDMTMSDIQYRHNLKAFSGDISIAGEVIPSTVLSVSAGDHKIKGESIGDLFNKVTDQAFALSQGLETVEKVLDSRDGDWRNVVESDLIETGAAVWGVPADQIQITR